MSPLQLILAFLIDFPICWLSWRYVVRPKLDRMIRDRARYEVDIYRRLQPTAR